MSELFINIATEPPLRLRDVRPDALLGIENVILRCLEKDRSRRFANVNELAAALNGVVGRPSQIQGATLAVAWPVSDSARQETPGSDTANAFGNTSKRGASGSKGMAVAAIAVAVVAIIATCIWVLRPSAVATEPGWAATSVATNSVTAAPPSAGAVPAIPVPEPQAPATPTARPAEPAATLVPLSGTTPPSMRNNAAPTPARESTPPPKKRPRPALEKTPQAPSPKPPHDLFDEPQ